MNAAPLPPLSAPRQKQPYDLKTISNEDGG